MVHINPVCLTEKKYLCFTKLAILLVPQFRTEVMNILIRRVSEPIYDPHVNLHADDFLFIIPEFEVHNGVEFGLFLHFLYILRVIDKMRRLTFQYHLLSIHLYEYHKLTLYFLLGLKIPMAPQWDTEAWPSWKTAC